MFIFFIFDIIFEDIEMHLKDNDDDEIKLMKGYFGIGINTRGYDYGFQDKQFAVFVNP